MSATTTASTATAAAQHTTLATSAARTTSHIASSTSAAASSTGSSAMSTIAAKDVKIGHLTNSVVGLSLTIAFVFLILIGLAVGYYLHKRQIAKSKARRAPYHMQYHARQDTPLESEKVLEASIVRKPTQAFFGSAKKYDESGVEMI
ncbi:hypothetical protein LTR85_002356 [Meristemomyces frigidus]|nr:hypothetical protein LTR85_002356 [Meristemomyces frigidus]